MYPKADIPLIQLSVDRDASMQEHYDIGKQLASLRKERILNFGSGNVTHNLRMASWQMQGGYDWAEEFDGYIKDSVIHGNYDNVIDYNKVGSSAKYAVPISDHYAPLLYVLGALDGREKISVFNDECVMGHSP